MPKVPKPVTPRKAGPGLTKPYTPSPALAAIVGSDPMPRTAVVANVWDHIRAHSLQDPADKRTIIADDKLRAVFGQDRCTMFEMQKLLSPHLTAA
jgi:chromatin remodeling complex protein RSC6